MKKLFVLFSVALFVLFVTIFVWFSFPMPVRSHFDGLYSYDVLLWIVKKPVLITGRLMKVEGSDNNILSIKNGGKSTYIKIHNTQENQEKISKIKIDAPILIKIKYFFFIPQYEIVQSEN